MVLRQACLLTGFIYDPLDVAPNVRRVIPVKVDDCLWCCVAQLTVLHLSIILTLRRWSEEIARDLIEIFLVSHRPYDINDLVEWHGWVVLQVGVDLVSKDSIIGDFLELERR